MKLFWLTLTLGFICCVSNAQQVNDSANQQLSTRPAIPFFLNFTCSIKDINKVVEHGTDTVHFETLSVLKRTDTDLEYELIDNNAFNGFNYYRLKCTDNFGTIVYSKILQVSSGKADFKFYPNPVDKLLIIETDHFSDLQIINAMGAVLITKQLQSGVQIINVSSLEKGDYLIRASDKSSNKLIIEHLLKN